MEIHQEVLKDFQPEGGDPAASSENQEKAVKTAHPSCQKHGDRYFQTVSNIPLALGFNKYVATLGCRILLLTATNRCGQPRTTSDHLRKNLDCQIEPGSYIQDLERSLGIKDPRTENLNPGFRNLDRGTRILDPGL